MYFKNYLIVRIILVIKKKTQTLIVMKTLTKDITFNGRNSTVLSVLKTPQLHMNVLIIIN